MGRELRRDYPGAWHHIGNRGLARRPIFQSGRDVSAFLDLLACVVQRGTLEIHAYTFMTNHFHLLARSPSGGVSTAMWSVESEYVRFFNRGRDRDGPLFRSRFWSRTIESGPYWHAVLRYIDRNPVVAGMAGRSIDHPYGSARWYVAGGGPSCLRKDVVESALEIGLPGEDGRPRRYPVEESERGGGGTDLVVESRIRRGGPGEDPLGHLVGASRAWVAEWMRRTTLVADGSLGPCSLVSPDELEGACLQLGAASGQIAAMLHLHGGLSLRETGTRIGFGTSTVHRHVTIHRERQGSEREYRELSAAILEVALRRCYGAGQPLPA